MFACVGDDVSINWTFPTEPHETVGSVFWLSENNTHIAYRFYKNFHPTLENFKEDYSSVTFTPEAGVTLHNVTSSAAGQYSVQVYLSGGPNPDLRTVNLILSGMYNDFIYLFIYLFEQSFFHQMFFDFCLH
jgi:hypothetical protein